MLSPRGECRHRASPVLAPHTVTQHYAIGEGSSLSERVALRNREGPKLDYQGASSYSA